LNFRGKNSRVNSSQREFLSEMKRDEATVSNQNQQNSSSSLPGETTTMKISDALKKLDCLYLLDAFEERDVRTVLDLENVLMDKLLVSSSEVKEEDDREEDKDIEEEYVKKEVIEFIAEEFCFGETKYAEKILEETKKELMTRKRNFNEEKKEKDTRTMTFGRMYSKTFLAKTTSLYDMHMGAENMGPFLYQLCRFTKPEKVLEIGAGYTSVYLMQALRDNKKEIEVYERMREEHSCVVRNENPNGKDTPWSNEAYFSRKSEKRKTRETYEPQLHVVDNMAHAHTTAHLVKECSEELNDDDEENNFLVVHEADAFNPDLSATLAPGVQFDFLWIDLGAANRIETFLKNFWFRVKPGGYVAVHSTLTNSLSREWLEKMRMLARNGGKNADGTVSEYGVFETMSFLEPHKLFQNSFTIFQRRDAHPIDSSEYAEPVLTKFP